MLGLSLSLTQPRGGERLGPELRATGTTGRISSGGATAAEATYNTATGAGTANRITTADQTYVQFTGLDTASTYRLAIQGTGTNTLQVRQSDAVGAVATTVGPGVTTTVDVSTGAGTGLFLTGGASPSSIGFTVTSLRKVP